LGQTLTVFLFSDSGIPFSSPDLSQAQEQKGIIPFPTGLRSRALGESRKSVNIRKVQDNLTFRTRIGHNFYLIIKIVQEYGISEVSNTSFIIASTFLELLTHDTSM
jgi:hypothetical protein